MLIIFAINFIKKLANYSQLMSTAKKLTKCRALVKIIVSMDASIVLHFFVTLHCSYQLNLNGLDKI